MVAGVIVFSTATIASAVALNCVAAPRLASVNPPATGVISLKSMSRVAVFPADST